MEVHRVAAPCLGALARTQGAGPVDTTLPPPSWAGIHINRRLSERPNAVAYIVARRSVSDVLPSFNNPAAQCSADSQTSGLLVIRSACGATVVVARLPWTVAESGKSNNSNRP